MIPDLEIRQLTGQMRDGDEPMWRRIRHLLTEKNIDPMRSVLAYFATEAPYYEFGVLVADDNEVYEFAFDYLRKDVLQGTFAEWSNVSKNVRNKPYRQQVELALQVKEKLSSG